MKIIGLTGGIGSGKSTVTDYLVSNGFHVLDADKIAREIVSPGSEMLIQLHAAFGDEIIQADGSLDRKTLGAIIFSDPEKKHALDRMMHSRILELIHERILQFHEEADQAAGVAADPSHAARYKVIFIDAPLLFETGLNRSTEEVWVIDADDETRIRRVMERDGLEREDILKRIQTQMAREEKKRMADVVLDNSGSQEALYQQLDQLLQKL